MDKLQFYLGITPLGALAVVISTAVLYLAFAAFLERWGQRLFASPSSLDLAVVTVLGAIVGRAILGRVPTLTAGVLALGTLIGIEGVYGRLRRSERRREQRHRAVAVMVRGRVDRAVLRHYRVDESAVWAALRAAGVRHPHQAALVVLEASGKFSVMSGGEAIHPAMLTGVRGAHELRGRLDQAGGPHGGGARAGEDEADTKGPDPGE